jgi:hypothetical protein
LDEGRARMDAFKKRNAGHVKPLPMTKYRIEKYSFCASTACCTWKFMSNFKFSIFDLHATANLRFEVRSKVHEMSRRIIDGKRLTKREG